MTDDSYNYRYIAHYMDHWSKLASDDKICSGCCCWACKKNVSIFGASQDTAVG